MIHKKQELECREHTNKARVRARIIKTGITRRVGSKAA